jgi:hypothetical protein
MAQQLFKLKRKAKRNLYSPILIPTEYQECKAFWEYAQLIPMLREYLIKHVNEGKRSAIGGKLLKGIGMRPGLPDYQYPVANEKFTNLWLEMKRIDGREKPKDPRQDEWIDKLNKIGHYASYAYGASDAISIYERYVKNLL